MEDTKNKTYKASPYGTWHIEYEHLDDCNTSMHLPWTVLSDRYRFLSADAFSPNPQNNIDARVSLMRLIYL